MTRRRAPRRARQMSGQRVGVDVEQPPVISRARCTRRPERNQSVDQRVSARACRRSAFGMPTRSEIHARRRRSNGAAATDERPHAASAPVRPTRRHAGGVQRRHEPGVDEARQHRDHDRRASRSSVMRSPSTCRFSMSGDFQRGVDFLAAAVHDHDRRRATPALSRRRTTVARCARSSRSSPPNFRTRGRGDVTLHFTT